MAAAFTQFSLGQRGYCFITLLAPINNAFTCHMLPCFRHRLKLQNGCPKPHFKTHKTHDQISHDILCTSRKTARLENT